MKGNHRLTISYLRTIENSHPLLILFLLHEKEKIVTWQWNGEDSSEDCPLFNIIMFELHIYIHSDRQCHRDGRQVS